MIHSAVSGLHAASLRLANSANNVANVHSTQKNVNGKTVQEAYTPTDVVQSSIEPTGGVRASVRERDPAHLEVSAAFHHDADGDGLVTLPNVSLDDEVVQQVVASNTYKSNLKSIEAYKETTESLLNITG